MRFSLIALAALVAPAVFASALPPSVNNAVEKAQLTFKDLLDGEDDPCPDMKVLCLNKDDEVVGDIGKQSFCHKGGLSCGQCHTKKNEAECQIKFPIACKVQCRTQGSPLLR
ncbi:hypothetical protein JCM8097_001552 [Rhodosporidiobolus ruineniae]